MRTLARERAAVRSEVETRGYSGRLQSYVSVYDGDEVDASLLLPRWLAVALVELR